MRSVLRSRLALAVMAIAVAAGYLTLPAARGADSTEAAVGNPVKIMLVGDSITSGRNGFPDEAPTYRAPLYELLEANGHSIDFVGSESGIDNGVNQVDDSRLTNTDPHHEGHNGWRADELVNGNNSQVAEGDIVDWITAQNPDVVVLYAGANDFAQGENPTEVFEDLNDAIDAIPNTPHV